MSFIYGGSLKYRVDRKDILTDCYRLLIQLADARIKARS